MPTRDHHGGIKTLRFAAGDSVAYAQSTVGTILEIDLKRAVVKRQLPMQSYADFDVSPDLAWLYASDSTNHLLRVFRTSALKEVRTYFLDNDGLITVAPDGRAVISSSRLGFETVLGDPVNGFTPGPRYPSDDFTRDRYPIRVVVSRLGDIAAGPLSNGDLFILK